MRIRTLRRWTLAAAALAAVAPARAPAGESVPVGGFEVRKVCACDCLYQYVIDVDADREGLVCRALDADGAWSRVSQPQYTPSPDLILYTAAEYTDFVCEAETPTH